MGRKNKRKNRRQAGNAPTPVAQAAGATGAGTGTGAVTAAAHTTAAPLSLRALINGHGRHALAVFAGLVVVYLATMPRVVTYEDEAIFNLICHYGQPAHPPGYPLYSLLCFPFAHLPFLSVPVAGNMLSALFGAAACAVLYLIAVGLGCGRGGGYLAGFGYGLSKLFWSQSIIQEVYSLHALLLLAALLLALLYMRGRNPAHLKCLAVVCGLGLSNHWVLTILSWPALLVLLLPARTDLLRHARGVKNLGVLAALFTVPAVLPYTYLLATNLPSPVNFYGPLNSLEALLHYVTREGYATTDNQQVSWFDKALYMKLVLTESAAQYGAAFLVFAAGGFVLQWKRWPWPVCCALIVLYLSTTVLLVWLVDFKFAELWAGVFSIYSIAAYCALALWAALAFEGLAGYCRDRIRVHSHGTRGARVFAAALTALLALLVAGVALSNFGFNNRAGDRFAFNQARTVLESFDEDAVVLLASDFQLPIMELNLVEGVREDVVLFNVSGLFLANRYVRANQDRARQDRAAADFVAHTFEQTRRPIYYFRDFEHGYGVEDFCVYKKIRKDWPAGKRRLSVLPEFLALWEESELKGDDLHFDAAAKRLFRRCVVGMILEAEDMDPHLKRTWQARLTNGGYYDLLSLIRFVSVYHKNPPGSATLEALIEKAQRLPAAATALPKDRAALLYAKAYDRIKRTPPAQWKDRQAMRDIVEILQRSLAVYPSSENPAAESLLKVLGGLRPKNEKELEQLRGRYPFGGA